MARRAWHSGREAPRLPTCRSPRLAAHARRGVPALVKCPRTFALVLRKLYEAIASGDLEAHFVLASIVGKPRKRKRGRPRCYQDYQRDASDGPRGPETAQERPKLFHDGLKPIQEAPKTPPRCIQDIRQEGQGGQTCRRKAALLNGKTNGMR